MNLFDKFRIKLGFEVWKKVEGYEGRIWVSNRGRAKGIRGILKLQVNNGGYFRVETTVSGKRARFLIQQAVARAFIKNCDAQAVEIDHIDRDKGNNWVENLEWVTGRENLKRKYERINRDKNETGTSEDERKDEVPF